MSLKRLLALRTFQQLPQGLQTAIQAHLLHGIDGPEACRMAGLTNPTRAWNAGRVQECIRSYRGGTDEKTVDELILEMERADIETARAERLAKPEPEKPAFEPPPIAPEPPPEPPTPRPDPVAPPKPPQAFLQREPSGPIVLGGESGIDTHELFRGIDSANLREWRRQTDAEQAERAALINIIEARRGY